MSPWDRMVVHEKSQKDSYSHLDPKLVLEATEAAGFSPTGEFNQLNSYENRVFDLRLEGMNPARIIAKFYRPGRWTASAIGEELAFLQELKGEGLTVATACDQKRHLPMLPQLSNHKGYLVAFFERITGRLPQELSLTDMTAIGRKLALLHNVGGRQDFQSRPVLGESPQTPYEVLDELLPRVGPEMRKRYTAVTEELLSIAQDTIDPDSFQRIHGDAHRGNILHNGKQGAESEFFFVDFDDCGTGPVVQDLWMLFSSSDSQEESEALIAGYENLREFPRHQLQWIPILRGLRIFQYAAWINKRWTDPSFPKLFPDFGTYNYWAEEVEALEKIVWPLRSTTVTHA